MNLTPELRDRLRAEVDRAVREHVGAQDAAMGARPCAGCGGRLTNFTWDCATCYGRFHVWKRRGVITLTEWNELSARAHEHGLMEKQRRSSESGDPGDFWNLYPRLRHAA